MTNNVNVGEILVAQALITRTQYHECLDYQQQHPDKPLTDIVLERGLCTREAMMAAIARYNGYAERRPDPTECVEAFEHAGDRMHANTNELAILSNMLAPPKKP